MAKRIRVKPGNLIAIPLEKNLVAVGIILHVSKVFKNAIMVGYYDHPFSSIEDISIEKISGEFIDTPNYTGKQLVTKGPWKLIGHSDELLAVAKIPELAVVHTIYYKDEVVKQYPAEEAETVRKYPVLEGQGGIFVENKLRRYFRKE